jgi:hypothetical protein
MRTFWTAGVVAVVLSTSACGSSGGDGPGGGDGSCGGSCTSSAECPGGVCVEGTCFCTDGGGEFGDMIPDGTVPDGSGDWPDCDPGVCATECAAAGFSGGACSERGCQCTRDSDAGDVDVPEVPPGTEICGDGLDNDGDTEVDEGCGCAVGETKPCYDGDPAVAGTGLCTLGMQTCEGAGEFGTWGVCVGSVMPIEEVCGNGQDDDCDGSADEGCVCDPGESRACYTGPAGTEGVGICEPGTQSCTVGSDGTAGWGPCTGQRLPESDACDGVDNDCDGTIDNFCTCPPGAVQPCYDGPLGTRDIGECYDGSQVCVVEAGGLISRWGPCMGWGGPRTEVCDGLDNDCDTRTDPLCNCPPGASRACYSGPPETRGVSPCRDGVQYCLGDGISSDWGACTSEVVPATEICGDRVDNDCDRTVDEGCDCSTTPRGIPPVVTCPPEQTTRALTTVTLTASASDDCRVDSTRWEVVAAPAGSGATPSSPASLTTTFTPDLVGEFRLRFTATDNELLSSSCEVRVASTGQGLRVELIWDVAGDVDLHMLHPSAAAWWNSLDCYFGNCNSSSGAVLEWDAPGTADNPRLDLDDIPGDGPENINIDVPVTGNVYRVGVHNYSASSCRNATVRIYCGDISLTPVATYTHSVCYNSGGDTRDVWRVVDVRWNGGDSCTVTALGTVITEAESRTMR